MRRLIAATAAWIASVALFTAGWTLAFAAVFGLPIWLLTR